ncbi:redoxin domain-containing protein [Candidatus Saccharibacteria bacterium]|nr:redoxin domain-containing protein [Candidatus Saccharibacteria bacterium]
MFLLLASFLAGMLTSLAPCILPLLPVIVGSAVLPGNNKKQDRKKPYVIVASLAVSVIVFTLLLKASTILIGVDPKVWIYLSGGIVVLLGVSMLLPNLWVQVSAKLGFEKSSNKLLADANKHSGFTGQILTGAALGPVFSACSPIYALVLATVLPVNLLLGMVYIVSYAAGLAFALLLIALLGRRITTKLGWAVNPNGWFRRVLAIILILVGLAVMFGYDKKFQTWTLEHLPFTINQIEEKLVPKDASTTQKDSVTNPGAKFNVENPYPAPELSSIQSWINSDGETIAKLKGKVVLIDFWTYSCINCIRTQPYLNTWHDKYKDQGLVIIGVHAPEFAFEKVPENVRKAVVDAKIGYPVGLDNEFATWKAYNNQYWPAKYLVDKDGNVRFTHFGEGKYDETEAVIQALLKEAGSNVNTPIQATNDSQNSGNLTPETYLGYERGERFANSNTFKQDETVNYPRTTNLASNQWSLSGNWRVGKLDTLSTGSSSSLQLRYTAKEVYLVMSGDGKSPARMTLNGQPLTSNSGGGSDVGVNGNLFPKEARLYRLVKSQSLTRDGLLEIQLPEGTTINAFTFGE